MVISFIGEIIKLIDELINFGFQITGVIVVHGSCFGHGRFSMVTVIFSCAHALVFPSGIRDTPPPG